MKKRVLTKLQKELREEHTYNQVCCVDGEPDSFTTWLRFGDQAFSLDGYQTGEESEWLRDMLSVALSTLFDDNK